MNKCNECKGLEHLSCEACGNTGSIKADEGGRFAGEWEPSCGHAACKSLGEPHPLCEFVQAMDAHRAAQPAPVVPSVCFWRQLDSYRFDQECGGCWSREDSRDGVPSYCGGCGKEIELLSPFHDGTTWQKAPTFEEGRAEWGQKHRAPAQGQQVECLDVAAERNAMQRQRDDVRKLLERECSDADAVLRLLGIDPESARTDGGFLNVSKIAEILASWRRAQSAPKRDREADRAAFTDPLFNKWLDEPVNDTGEFTVWHMVGDIGAAWHGWENRQFYVDEEYADLRARAAQSAPAGALPGGWKVSVVDCGDRSGQATISGPGVYCMQVPVSYSMLDFMQALAASYRRNQSEPAAHEGWRLVPVEPTEEMIDAGCREHTCVQGDSWYSESEISEHDAIAVFKAMLAAAPQPAARRGGTREALNEALATGMLKPHGQSIVEALAKTPFGKALLVTPHDPADGKGYSMKVVDAQPAASQEQGDEVRRLREALEKCEPYLADKVHYASDEADDCRYWRLELFIRTPARNPEPFDVAAEKWIRAALSGNAEGKA